MKNYTQKEFVEQLNLANKGDSDAQYTVGRCYESGKGIKMNKKRAKYWFKRSALQGNTDGECALGVCYYNGIACEQDMRKALELYIKGIQKNNPKSLFNMAIFLEKHDKDQYGSVIFNCYLQAAEMKYHHAVHNIAKCYARGIGVKKNVRKMKKWLRKASKLGNYKASLYLYQLFTVEGKDKKAFPYLRRAAEAGCLESQWRLGVEYQIGIRVERNMKEALTWIKRSARGGDSDAMFWLGKFYSDLGEYKKALHWYIRALKNGDIEAAHPIAIMYYTGRGIKKDFSKVIEYAQQADPFDYNIYNMIALSYLELNIMPDNALELAEMLVESDIVSPYYNDTLGYAYYRLGRYDEAAEKFQYAYLLDPDNLEIREHYEMLQHRELQCS